MQQFFSTLVRTLLQEQSISGNQLAQMVNYDRGALSRIVAGRRPCSPQLAELIDDVLGAQGSVVAAAAAAALPHAADRACQALNTTLRFEAEPAGEAGDWTQSAADLAYRTRRESPPQLLGPLSGSLQALAASIPDHRSASDRDNLTRIAALMGTLACRIFIRAGDQPRWTQWACTARQAAAMAHDSTALAWANAQAGLGYYYAGDMGRAAAAAEAALAPPAGTGAGAACAAALQMRVHAAAGDTAATLAAARNAERLLGRLPDSPAPSAWDYDVGQFTFHQAEALYFLGDPAARRHLADASARLASRDDYLYWSATRLVTAACMIRDGDITEALAHAAETLANLRPEERPGLIACQCRDVIELLPRDARDSEAGRTLRSLLAAGETRRPLWSETRPRR